PVLVDLQRDAGFKGPHRVFTFGGTRLAAVAILLTRLPLPSGVVLIVFANRLIELPRDAADDRFVADVGLAESSGGQATDAVARLDQHYRFAHSFGLHSGCDTAGRAAIDDDVVGCGLSGRRRGNE